jgi:hypothetical protein
LRQRDDENLIDYTRRFKSAEAIMEAKIDEPIVLAKYGNMKIESGEETCHEKLQKQAWEQLLTYMYIRTADSNKYVALIDVFPRQFSWITAPREFWIPTMFQVTINLMQHTSRIERKERKRKEKKERKEKKLLAKSSSLL